MLLGCLSLFNREINAMSALYPVLMLIVGTSDVIHILSKYLDELRKGLNVPDAIENAIKDIGVATLFTSLTTAIGFLSLMTSRIKPVRDFGINASLGVVIAYITVILLGTSLMTFYSNRNVTLRTKKVIDWNKLSLAFYRFSKKHKVIYVSSFVILFLSLWGVSKISTDYDIMSTLPRGKKVTSDFKYFEKNVAGFRSIELDFSSKDKSDLLNAHSIRAISDIQKHLDSSEKVSQTFSLASVIQSPAFGFANIVNADLDSTNNVRAQSIVKTMLEESPYVLLNEDMNRTRIRTQINDIGTEEIERFSEDLTSWINTNIDTSSYAIQITGIGKILDKNAYYVRESLLKGLAFALVIIAVLMGFLFSSWKMLFISLVPNTLPLILVGALLGYFQMPLEPLSAITFAVVFGIAVDDTIHFLSK